MKALKIPPAWRDVHLSVDPDAALQAVGLDSKNRTVYRRSAEQDEAKAAENFSRMKDFGGALPALRDRIAQDLLSDDPAVREAAAVVYLIDKTAFRIGSTADTGSENQAYGATTLRSSHVKIVGDKVSFRFTGKKGVAISETVRDATLAKILSERMKPRARLFDVSDDDVRVYMKSRMDQPFTPKDFRTYYGTALALERVKSMRVPNSEKALKKAMREVAESVSKYLGNTPAVALKSYIAPAVWSRWKARK